MSALLWFVVGAAAGVLASRSVPHLGKSGRIRKVTLVFDGKEIEADPDTLVIGHKDQVEFTAKSGTSDDHVNIEFAVKGKTATGNKKVKGPFKERNDATNPHRGVYRTTGSNSVKTEAPDQNPGKDKYDCWKYKVDWTRGDATFSLDPDVMIKGGN